MRYLINIMWGSTPRTILCNSAEWCFLVTTKAALSVEVVTETTLVGEIPTYENAAEAGLHPSLKL